jgi:ABC-type lipoprotein release transport system permease subunit
MGKLLVVWRLAVRDLRHNLLEAVLLLLAVAAAATTLTMGLALRGTTDSPYARTQAATNGPDVVADVQPAGFSGAADPRELAPLESAPGVVAHGGPFPVTWALLSSGRTTAGAEVEGRSASPSAADQPKVLNGSWLRPGGVVVEAGFADALGLHVGDRLSLGNRSFRVDGIAVTAAFPSYTQLCAVGCTLVNALGSYNPGLVWAPQADVASLATMSSEPVEYVLNLKLANPGAAPSFAARYSDNASPTGPSLIAWQDIRGADAKALANVQLVLLTGSSLLALLALASVTVLVGGRMAEQKRRVGLLKAVGGTPGLVAVVLLAEHLLVGLCAAAAGLFAGWLAGPLVDAAGAGLLGVPSVPPLTGSTVGLVVALALAVAIVATFVPALRAARQSTVAALDDAARPPRRRAAMVRLSAHLPATLLLGARLAVRRPRRLLLTVFSVAVTVSGIVAVMILRATSAGWSLGPRVTEATTLVSVMLVVLAAVNAVFIAWTTVLEARHPAALARALGATPEQITTGLSASQLPPALLGALLGIPGGVGIYDAAKNGGTTTIPSVLGLVAMVVVTLAVIAALTAVPTRIGARRPVAEVLQAEGR